MSFLLRSPFAGLLCMPFNSLATQLRYAIERLKGFFTGSDAL